MADKKISELPAVTSLTSGDVIPVVQAGNTVKVTTPVLAVAIQQLLPTEAATSAIATTGLSTINALGGAYTLAAGSAGVEKTIVASATGTGTNSTVIVTTTSGGASGTITFTAKGQVASLLNVGGTWFVSSLYGCTVTGF